ncbi:MAG: DUF86 domain-containing protein [Smithella sp.]|jgi:uncharacterized protein YutE (UPF0331/DUF86 family)
MPDKDVILAKVASIQKCLRRIREITDLKPDTLDDINKQDIFVLNLQRAVQSAIDLAAHIIASEGLGMPDTIKDNFVKLEQAGILNKDLSQKMQSMAGFRNIAIHDYQAINVEILKTILARHLKDLEDFYTGILEYFNFTKQ